MTRPRLPMRRLLLGLPLAAAGCSAGGVPGADRPSLEQAIAREAGKLTAQGVSGRFVIGVEKAGRTYVEGFQEPPSAEAGRLGPDSLLQIGSLTKLFTVATLLSLVEDGGPGLDDHLARLVGGRVPLSRAAGNITLRQLASHTSGLPPMPAPLLALPRDDADPYARLDREAVYRYLATTEGLRSPGRVAYSNYGMGLLGHVLEDVAGAGLEQLMAARVFAPLSMSSTFMTPLQGSPPALAPGTSQAGKAAAPWRFGALAGAGGLCSTASDMLAFVRANLAMEGPLEPVLERMRRERGPNGSRLGWMAPSVIDRAAGSSTMVWHNGRVGGYASYLSLDVTDGTGVVILSAKSAEVTVAGVMLNRAVREHDWRKMP